MTESTLDRLDRDPGGARQYVATLIVVGGATRAQIAEALARKYSIPEPTSRSVTAWKNGDPELRAIVEAMEAAKRDLAPGEDPTQLIPEPVDPAEASGDLFDLAIRIPSFGTLLYREGQRDDDQADDVLAVLAAGHATAAEFEADCIRRLGDYNPHVPTPGSGSLA